MYKFVKNLLKNLLVRLMLRKNMSSILFQRIIELNFQ